MAIRTAPGCREPGHRAPRSRETTQGHESGVDVPTSLGPPLPKLFPLRDLRRHRPPPDLLSSRGKSSSFCLVSAHHATAPNVSAHHATAPNARARPETRSTHGGDREGSSPEVREPVANPRRPASWHPGRREPAAHGMEPVAGSMTPGNRLPGPSPQVGSPQPM